MMRSYYNAYGSPGRPAECMELPNELECPNCTDADDGCEVCGCQAVICWTPYPERRNALRLPAARPRHHTGMPVL